MGDENFAFQFNALGRNQAVIAGIEAHVCVLQTAMDLIGQGVQVFVVADATSSRSPDNQFHGPAKAKWSGRQYCDDRNGCF